MTAAARGCKHLFESRIEVAGIESAANARWELEMVTFEGVAEVNFN